MLLISDDRLGTQLFLGKGRSVTERPSRTLPSTRHNRIEGQTSRMFVLAEHS
jgi:hypothetical protein